MNAPDVAVRCEICGSADLREHREGVECQQCGAVTTIRGYVHLCISRKTLMMLLEAMDYYNILFHRKDMEFKAEEFKTILKRTDFLQDWNKIRADDEVY